MALFPAHVMHTTYLRPSHREHTWPAAFLCRITSCRDAAVNTPVSAARDPNATPNVPAMPPTALAAATAAGLGVCLGVIR